MTPLDYLQEALEALVGPAGDVLEIEYHEARAPCRWQVDAGAKIQMPRAGGPAQEAVAKAAAVARRLEGKPSDLVAYLSSGQWKIPVPPDRTGARSWIVTGLSMDRWSLNSEVLTLELRLLQDSYGAPLSSPLAPLPPGQLPRLAPLPPGGPLKWEPLGL